MVVKIKEKYEKIRHVNNIKFKKTVYEEKKMGNIMIQFFFIQEKGKENNFLGLYQNFLQKMYWSTPKITISSKSKWAFLAELPLDLVNFFKLQDGASCSIQLSNWLHDRKRGDMY